MLDFYADRLGNVTVAGGVVRLDFMRLTSLNPETKEARLDPAFRLALPVDGWMQAIETLDKIRADLVQQAQAAQAAQAARAGTPS